MSDDQLTATLAEIRAFDYKPVPQGSEVFEQAIRAARDVPRLLALVAVQRAALDAVLKLADEWGAEAKWIDAKFAGEEDPWPRTVAGMRAQAFEQCAKALREAITAELTKGEAPGHG